MHRDLTKHLGVTVVSDICRKNNLSPLNVCGTFNRVRGVISGQPLLAWLKPLPVLLFCQQIAWRSQVQHTYDAFVWFPRMCLGFSLGTQVSHQSQKVNINCPSKGTIFHYNYMKKINFILGCWTCAQALKGIYTNTKLLTKLRKRNVTLFCLALTS